MMCVWYVCVCMSHMIVCVCRVCMRVCTWYVSVCVCVHVYELNLKMLHLLISDHLTKLPGSKAVGFSHGILLDAAWQRRQKLGQL